MVDKTLKYNLSATEEYTNFNFSLSKHPASLQKNIVYPHANHTLFTKLSRIGTNKYIQFPKVRFLPSRIDIEFTGNPNIKILIDEPIFCMVHMGIVCQQ